MKKIMANGPNILKAPAQGTEPWQRMLNGNPLLAARVLENIMDGVLITDADAHIQYVNPAFAAITGYSADEVMGKNPRILKSDHQDAEFYQYMWTSLSTRGQWQGEIWNRRKNGEIYPEWENIAVIKDGEGKVTNYVAIFSDITALKNMERRFHHLAHHDPLTGLPNRLLFQDRLQLALVQAKRQQQALAVLFIDIDNFKTINDMLGHAVGDQLIKTTAERLTQCVRNADTVARLGGDEFVALLVNLKNPQDAERVAKKIISAVAKVFVVEGHELSITASIGVSLYPQDGQDTNALIKNADTAMYRAKQHGKNNYQLYTSSK
jgi:diguanylate cyclase (GGDEF)-like protein/PAS domain S-box-containing protein